MIYRVTFGFEGLGKGWSESHALKDPSDNPIDQLPKALNVAQKRVTFLGREFSINAIRISRYSDDAATTRAKGVYLSRTILRNPVQTVAQAAEPAEVALLAAGTTGANLAPPAFVANTNRTFLGAPPDPAVDNGGFVDPSKSNLQANYSQWAALLTGGNWGWLVNGTIADLTIDTITQNANGTVTITTVEDFPVGVTIGKYYPARARRINQGASPINGQLIIRPTAAKTMVTQEVIGLALSQEGGFIRLYQAIQPFAAFQNLNLLGVVGKHQRGRPFGSTRGRAPNRIRG